VAVSALLSMLPVTDTELPSYAADSMCTASFCDVTVLLSMSTVPVVDEPLLEASCLILMPCMSAVMLLSVIVSPWFAVPSLPA